MSVYSNYYSAADVTAFIEGTSEGGIVMLDKLKSVGFSESISSGPIYGVGNPKFGFVNTGNLFINGFLDFNFIHPNYLKNAILIAKPPHKLDLDNSNIKSKFTSASHTELNNAVNLIKNAQAAIANSPPSATGIDTFPENFNIRIVFNNGNLYYGDTPKTYIIRGVKIVGSQLSSSVTMDGAISILYKFLARDLVSK
jgi:hypothetical protein